MSAHPVISELHDLVELRELEALFATIWERSTEAPVTSDMLRALSHSGNYVAGARLEGRLVGGLVGWFGGSPADLHLHSHILGVLPDTQLRGLGFVLKQHQRSWCLARGVSVIEWTTDPLVRRNAYFNIHKLGAQAREYFVNFYGAMADGLNVGEESDRLLITWDIASVRAEAAAAGHAEEPVVDEMLRDGAATLLSVGSAGEPVAGSASSARVLLCQVPVDIVGERRANPAQARSWRLALRAALVDAFAAGYRVSGATRTGWYVLRS